MDAVPSPSRGTGNTDTDNGQLGSSDFATVNISQVTENPYYADGSTSSTLDLS